MTRPDAVRAVRMYLFYRNKVESEENDQLSDDEYAGYEHRHGHYQSQVYALCPTEAEILAGCGGIDGKGAEDIRDMLDVYAEQARKGWG